MSRIRHNAPGNRLRLHSIADARRKGEPLITGPGADCTGNPLGERLGIAAIYGGQGDAAAAQATALLACADATDTPANRAAVLDQIESIRACVRAAIRHAGGLH